MTSLPEERASYPYRALGYDLPTMVRAFAGYGKDVELDNGLRVSALTQMELSCNFLQTCQKYFGDWSLNDISAYCYVMQSTILGELIGVKELAADLGLPISTTSHVLSMLESREVLQSYPCVEDKRRKWVRLHPRVIEKRLNGEDIWKSQRELLKNLLVRDND